MGGGGGWVGGVGGSGGGGSVTLQICVMSLMNASNHVVNYIS